jgi:hypothetical protein
VLAVHCDHPLNEFDELTGGPLAFQRGQAADRGQQRPAQPLPVVVMQRPHGQPGRAGDVADG